MSSKVDFMWVHCNECGQETKHGVLHQADRSRSFDAAPYTVEVGTSWKLLQCRGCEEVALRRIDWCSEDDPTGSPLEVFFPPRVSRRKPDWLIRNEYEVPQEYQTLLSEVYTALHADSRRLAVMGARALVDVVIRRNVGDQATFAKGLDALENEKLISQQDRGIIEAAVNVGHASAHRGHSPKIDDVQVVMDIVERIVHAELLVKQAKALKKSTPKRKRKRAANKV